MSQERIIHDDDGDTEVVQSDNAAGTAVGASALIRTIVWAVVVLILLAVALWALHVYVGLF